MADLEERTIPPTPERRRQAREEGRVPHSAELTSAALFLAGVGLLVLWGYPLMESLASLMRDCLSGRLALATDADGAASLLGGVATRMSGALLPIVALASLVALGTNLAQTRFLFLPSRAAPDMARVSLAEGWRRLFSGGGGGRLAIGCLKIAVLGGVAYHAFAGRWRELIAAGGLEAPLAARRLWGSVLGAALEIGLGLTVVAALDYFLRWRRHERSLWMTPEEFREELRSAGGNRRSVRQKKL